jgi:phage shock protein A
MFQLLRKWWKYLTAKGNVAFDEHADPKIQLEQAIRDAQEQHQRLIEQAANVVANEKQTQLRLDRSLEELEQLNGSARQAVLMADQATRNGDTAKAAQYTQAAESFANRLIAVEKEVEGMKQLRLQAAEAAEQAKRAVAQNSTALQAKLAERQKLLSQLDQAKMQEQVSKAMASLSETVGKDSPTLAEVRDKIEARYAKAQGQAELSGQTVEARMLEVEHARMNTEAQARLAEIRTRLGIAAPEGTPADAESQAQAEPGPAEPSPG